jgi:hypothetical protein
MAWHRSPTHELFPIGSTPGEKQMSKQIIQRPSLKPPAVPVKSSPIMEVTGVPREQQEALALNMRKTCVEWVSQIGQMHRLDVEFAARLAGCTKPSDAVALCGKWMGHHVDSAVAMQHRLLELWLDAMTAATRLKVDASVPRAGNDDAGTADGRPSGV